MADQEEAPSPGKRNIVGLRTVFLSYFVVFPIVAWVAYPIAKSAFGKVTPYLLIAICGAVLLWGWFRERRRRSTR